MMFVFISFAGPTSSYALANAALSQGVKPQLDDDGENAENAEDGKDAPSNP
jgi:multisubunit Na+/H+ antiporter MnhG subunit